MNKCRNLLFDEDNSPYCRSTHVCYKHFCCEGSLFDEPLRLFHGRIRPLSQCIL